MRDAFIDQLTDLATEDSDIVFLTGDLGFGAFDEFDAKFNGSQYFNIGVAEQNMTGVATGLALEGKRVFTYSIANFGTLRCLEQIRNDAAYHNANVTVVSNGGGFSYGPLGMSHHATEDLAILRSLPDVDVVAPSSIYEVKEAVKALAFRENTGYLRLDKTINKDDSEKNGKFELGKLRQIVEGKDLSIIATGGILNEALKVANELSRNSIDCAVISCPSIKPLDKEGILKIAESTENLITLEEHNLNGGLGSAISEVLLDENVHLKNFKRIGLNNTFSSVVGSQEFLRKYYEMDAEAIFKTVKQWI